MHATHVRCTNKITAARRLRFFIHLLVLVSISAVWWQLFRYRWCRSFGTDLLKSVLWRSLYVLAIWSFFLISVRKSIIYALLYISATLTEQIFSGCGLWMKKINLCRCNNSFDFHYIFLTSQAPPFHYRNIQLLIEEYSLLWGLSTYIFGTEALLYVSLLR